MKEYSKIQKIISALMIFILLPYLCGCTSTKIISNSDLPLPDSGKYAYIVHSERSKFLLHKEATISNDTLSGRIKQIYSDESNDSGNKLHLYLSSDSVIKFEKGEFLSVPLNDVIKVEQNDLHWVGTFFIITGSVLVVLVGLGIYSWSHMEW